MVPVALNASLTSSEMPPSIPSTIPFASAAAGSGMIRFTITAAARLLSS